MKSQQGLHYVIVSYTFPPSKEIGGRRWAKFSKYLNQFGQKVTVICTHQGVSADWYRPEYGHVSFKFLPASYPEWLTGFTRNYFDKIKYHWYTKVLSLFTKKNFFDKGYALRIDFLESLESVHSKKKIDVLVVTGAPFSLLYYGAEFKKRHPEIVFVSDFRDPWTWGGYYGLDIMPEWKRKHQEEQEYETVKNADLVCYPTSEMGKFFLKKYPQFKQKFELLSHAYDEEKFLNIKTNQVRNGFIYGGTLYDGIEPYLESLSIVLKSMPHISFEWNVYTGFVPQKIQAIFSNLPQVKFNELVSEEELFQRIASSSAYLAFFPNSDKDLISTKFFEIINTNTPILFVGDEGVISQFIINNRLGIHILPQNLELELPKYLIGNFPPVNSTFDVTKYTFANVTKQFMEKVSILADAL